MRVRAEPVGSVALERGVGFLCRAQHGPGNWTDFWLSVGTSDEWVTAWTGLSLHGAAQCPKLAGPLRGQCSDAVQASASWLASRERRGGGWGYNQSVAVDADSTAHAISLIARAGGEISASSIACLMRHQLPASGFRTYAFDDGEHAWTRPCADVTAAALRALFDAGQIGRRSLASAFERWLQPGQAADGYWRGYWWPDPLYTTALVLEVWRHAGGGGLLHEVPPLQAGGAFNAACRLGAAVSLDREPEGRAALEALIALQLADGSWPGDAEVRVPPSHPHLHPRQPISSSRDARRIFTTAAAVRAMTRALHWAVGARRASTPQRRNRLCDGIVAAVAREAGFSEGDTLHIGSVFRTLTRASLDDRRQWPAPQLSSLSGGVPLEFSALTQERGMLQLRYTVEPGEVEAAPHRRAATSLDALGAAATELGYAAGWHRLLPALERLVTPCEASRDWRRFVVWAGVDHESGGTRAGCRTTLKAYVHLFSGEGERELEAALGLARLPVSKLARDAFTLLGESGFAQEVGFGLAEKDAVGVKVYFELGGWQRALVGELLNRTGFSGGADALCPAIPGLLSESLARHTRSGVALRLDPITGDVAEITTAIQLIQGMLAPATIATRVAAWIESQDGSALPHQKLFMALARLGRGRDMLAGPRHTLFTRSQTRQGACRAAFYIRPSLTEH